MKCAWNSLAYTWEFVGSRSTSLAIVKCAAFWLRHRVVKAISLKLLAAVRCISTGTILLPEDGRLARTLCPNTARKQPNAKTNSFRELDAPRPASSMKTGSLRVIQIPNLVEGSPATTLALVGSKTQSRPRKRFSGRMTRPVLVGLVRPPQQVGDRSDERYFLREIAHRDTLESTPQGKVCWT